LIGCERESLISTIYRAFPIPPLRGKYMPYVGEEEILKGAPPLAPVKTGADCHKTVPLMLNWNNWAAEALHQPTAILFGIVPRHFDLHEPKGFNLRPLSSGRRRLHCESAAAFIFLAALTRAGRVPPYFGHLRQSPNTPTRQNIFFFYCNAGR